MPAAAHPQIVAEWIGVGYNGLRIPRCPACRLSTWQTWAELKAEEHVVDVARRLSCSRCGTVPPGLAVVATVGQQ